MESNARTRARATHEFRVFAEDGTPKEVQIRQLSLEQTQGLIDIMRKSSPEAREWIDKKLNEAKKEEDNG